MDAKTDLHRAYMQLRQAGSAPARSDAARELQAAALKYAEIFEESEPPAPQPALLRDAVGLAATGDTLDSINDETLESLNKLLPWGAMTIDRKGRIVGGSWSATKRTAFNPLLERRLEAFNAEYPLKGRHVLEVGCFEGIHTLGCLILGATVTGVDGRIENIVKTLARLWAYGRTTPLVLWNLEHDAPPTIPPSWDVLHHFGVLYHLSNPVEHLQATLPRTTGAVILDTHVARENGEASASYSVKGKTYFYRTAGERFTDVNPFAGLANHAKWLRLDDIYTLFHEHGFSDVRTISDRDERNGRRVTVWAFR